VSQAARWLDGFAAFSARLGVRSAEGLRELLPPDAPLPAWWAAAGASREARASVLAPVMARVHHAIEKVGTRPDDGSRSLLVRGDTTPAPTSLEGRLFARVTGDGDGAAKALTSVSGPATRRMPGLLSRRVLPAELVRAYREAEAADAEATRRDEASAVAEASRQAEAIVTEANRVLAEANRMAEASAVEASRILAEARASAEREAEAVRAAAWLVLRSAEARGLAASEGLVLTVARLLAERLIGRALGDEPALMVDLAREALRTVVRARRILLRVHPADAESIRGRLGELGLEATAIDVCADPERPRGGLRAETDLGDIDADIGPQLDRLLDVLRQLAEEKAKKVNEREQP
jgi:flagellar biosynthesis/type III secretory pathway protein FliH